MPVLREQRNAAEVEHIQDITVAQFILQGKADEVKIRQRIARFERIQRDIMRAHLFFHIHPRRENTLTPNVRLFVKKAVEDLDAEVRHTDLINIGKTEREPHVHLLLVLDDSSEFTADIAAGFLHLQEQFFDFFRDHRLLLICRSAYE